MTFKIGQKVICIDGAFGQKERYWICNCPEVGAIYTIENIELGFRGVGLRLIELRNPLIPISTKTGIIQFEPTFLETRFRSAPDISALTQLLHSTELECVS